jgi:acylphosphatase
MKVFFRVHGTVQGVGYRAFVRFVAKKYFVKGMVRNVRDGTVEILAIGDAESLASFERDIEVYDKYGPQVFHVEKAVEGDAGFDKGMKEYSNFIIEKDRKG